MERTVKHSVLVVILGIVCWTGYCDENAFENKSYIRFNVEDVYPKDRSDVPINSSIIINFDQKVKDSVVSDKIIIQAGDGTVIPGEYIMMGDAVIFMPDPDVLLKPGLEHAVLINNLTGVYRNKINNYRCSFHTGKGLDTEGPVAVKASMKNRTAAVFFNEALLCLDLRQGAVSIFDLTAENAVSGSVSCEPFSNQVIFTADRSFIADHKYEIHVHTGMGIADVAHNDFTSDNGSFTVFPAPLVDDVAPTVEYIETLQAEQGFIIHFSEKIDQFNMLKDEFQDGRIYFTADDYVNLDRRVNGIVVMSKIFQDQDLYYYWYISVSLLDDHTGIKVRLTDENPSNPLNGSSARVQIMKDAILDLSGKRLQFTPGQNCIDNGDNIEYSWIVNKPLPNSGE